MANTTIKEIKTKFKGRASKEWAFTESRSIDFWTHGYHRYPAKFIPQVVKKLLETYTKPGDRVGDVFAGCGTTLVECKVHGLESIGVDINPVAKLITNAKIQAIEPALLEQTYTSLQNKMETYTGTNVYPHTIHDRIDYWFKAEAKNKIAFLYNSVNEIAHKRARDFFLCSLSNILKNCSVWLQDSTKPQTDPQKKPADPFLSFNAHTRKMLKRNRDFYTKLKSEKKLTTDCKIKLADARHTRLEAGSLNAIITSPPYVTSYEYADIHQLTGYWFDFIADLSSFRKKFIGTFHSLNKNLFVRSQIADQIVTNLKRHDMRMACEVANYFNNMYDVAGEMKRILAPGGVVCLVIGNTMLRKVNVNAAEAFAEILSLNDFIIEQVIKRKIVNKQIPTIRNKVNGKFAKLEDKDSKRVYPNEYIIIARKRENVN